MCVVNHGASIDDNRLICQDDNRYLFKRNFRYGLTMPKLPDPIEFERKFIERVAEIIKESPGMNHSKFARIVWGDVSGVVEKWRRIRNSSKKGKPQNLTLSDALRMMNALQTEFPSFAWETKQDLDLEVRRSESMSESSELPPNKSG